MNTKKFISAEQLLQDSFQLGAAILNSGFTPNFIVGVWRGGTPVGIALQELLDYCGVTTDHIAIRTSYYTGINQTAEHVQVHGLNYIANRVTNKDRLLLVDDVFDTGASMQQIILHLRRECGENIPEVRIATPYFKPENNVTDLIPDYYLYETSQWLVFRHELKGLSKQELLNEKPGIEAIKNLLLEHLHSAT